MTVGASVDGERAFRKAFIQTGMRIQVSFAGSKFHAHAFRSHEQAKEYVRATVTGSYTLADLSRLIDDATSKAVTNGSGNTIGEAIAKLGENIEQLTKSGVGSTKRE